MESSKRKGLFWIVVIGALAAVMGGAIPWMAGKLPWSVEQRLSKSMMNAMMPGLQQCKGGAGDVALQKLVRRIFPVFPEDQGVPLEVSAIRGETVNAFAALGGKIFIYEGLIAQTQSPEELAAVIAHESEHVRHRHVFQGLFLRLMIAVTLGDVVGAGEWMPALLQLKFSRKQESRADRDGLARLRAAEVDVSGFRTFFERMASPDGPAGGLEPPEILSDHPSSAERAGWVSEFSGGSVRPVLTRPEWSELREICKKMQ